MFSDVNSSHFTDSSRTASAWPPPQSSTTTTTTSAVSRPKGMAGAGLNMNDLSSSKSNSNLDFANFSNVFQNTATASSSVDPFLDQRNNNSHSTSNTNGGDELFADFNDNFGSAAMTTTTSSSKDERAHQPAFDPFGISTSSTTNNNNHNSKGTINNFSATFDDDDDDPFGDSLPKQTQDKVSRSNGDEKKNMKNINNNNNSNVKSANSNGKFSADYSKNFETDLEEVLKRSVFEQ